ncbi:glycosyltransferase WbuB [Pseudomonadales bacterium]|nr:glycosyltransferase WbuB [Pseudomonadales bacterium]
MRLLIYCINYSPELTGIGKYTGEMAPWLAKKNVNVRVVTAPPYYPNWRVSGEYKNRYSCKVIDDVDVLRCPLFVPQSPSTFTRLVHLASFSLSSFLPMLGQVFWRPNVVVVIAPSLFCAPVGLMISALCGAKTVLHIQDYELDAMFGLNMMKNTGGRMMRLAAFVERWLLRRFDRVSTISFSMMRRAQEKGADESRIMHTPNWVDTDFVAPSISGARYRALFGFTSDHKIVLYSGNIGEKQGLSMVLEAAALYVNRSDVQFVIVGNGVQREKLVGLSEKLKLTNVHFSNLVPYEDLPDLLAMADVHLVVQRKGAADVVLPSKLTSILSLGGHALITAEQDTELALLVERYPGIACLVKPEDLSAFVAGLDVLLSTDTRIVNDVARDYAVEKLAKDAVLTEFLAHLSTLAGAHEFRRDH